MIIGDACCFKHWPLVGAVEHPTLYINIPHFVYIVLFEKKSSKKNCVIEPTTSTSGLLRGDDITVTGVPLTAAVLGFFSPPVFRGFWTLLMVLGLGSALVGGFLLVCGVPFYSHKLYKVGGAFLVASGKKKK